MLALYKLLVIFSCSRGTKARDGSGQGMARSPSLRVVLWSWHCTFGWKTCRDVPWSKHRMDIFSKKGMDRWWTSPIHRFRWAIYRAILNMYDHTYTRNIPCFDRGTSGRVSSCSVGLRRLCFGIAWDPHLAAQHLRRAWFVLGVELDTSWLGFSALIAVSGVRVEGQSSFTVKVNVNRHLQFLLQYTVGGKNSKNS